MATSERMEPTARTKPAMEDFGFEENGTMYWWASWYGDVLGYRSMATFRSPMRKAMQACQTLQINTSENFVEVPRTTSGKKNDVKLTRFACYLIAMNADGRKPLVARAQVYFAEQIEKINLVLEGTKDIERLLIRHEIKEGNLTLNSEAARSGVNDFRLFMNEGYLGLYNGPIREIKRRRGLRERDSLFDFMGRTELAANLFRITMTEECLKRTGNRSEDLAAAVHRKVGADVRKMVYENTGRYPEKLPIERKLSEVSRTLKKAKQLLNKKTA